MRLRLTILNRREDGKRSGFWIITVPYMRPMGFPIINTLATLARSSLCPLRNPFITKTVVTSPRIGAMFNRNRSHSGWIPGSCRDYCRYGTESGRETNLPACPGIYARSGYTHCYQSPVSGPKPLVYLGIWIPGWTFPRGSFRNWPCK